MERKVQRLYCADNLPVVPRTRKRVTRVNTVNSICRYQSQRECDKDESLSSWYLVVYATRVIRPHYPDYHHR